MPTKETAGAATSAMGCGSSAPFSEVLFGPGLTNMNLPTQFILAAAALAALQISRAQTVPPPVTLSPYIVNGVPVDESVNPLTR